MAFSGLDVGVQESIFLLCAIVIGGIVCSVIFLQCCRCTVGGRADRLYEEEHQRALEEQRRATLALINEAKESRHKNENSVSISPLNVPLQPPQKQFNSGDSVNLLLGVGGTPGLASAPPRPKPQINIDIPKGPDLILAPWSSLSNQSGSIQAVDMVDQPPLQLHAAQSRTFMDEKKWGENAVQRGQLISGRKSGYLRLDDAIALGQLVSRGTGSSYQFADGDMGVTLKRVSSKKYDGRLVNLETPRLKLVDLAYPEVKTRTRNSSFELALESKTTEL